MKSFDPREYGPRQRGVTFTIYLIVAAVLAVTHISAFLYGQKLEAEGWIAQVVNLEGELHDLKTAGDDRAKRAEQAAKVANAELVKARKQAEVDRAKAVSIRNAWDDFIRVQSEARASNGVDALTACRADVSAYAGALDRVIKSAVEIHFAATLNTEQLKQLQAWLREASK